MPEAQEPSVRVERRVQAGPDRLFELWTDPQLLPRWWRLKGLAVTGAEVDPRPGGAFRLTLQPPGGDPFDIVGEYLEILPGRKIVQTWRYSGSAVRDEVKSVVTIDLLPEGKETLIVITQVFDTARAAPSGRERGWNQILDGLAGHLQAS